MKKLNLIIGILIGFTILSCSSDDNNGGENDVKLLKKITFSGDGNYSLNFFYNSDNTIDKIQSSGTGDDFIKQFYYNNGILDRAEFQDLNALPNGSIEKYAYNNGQLTKREDYFDNTILDETFEYSFSNQQINNIQYMGSNETAFSEQYIFEYDSNNNVVSRKKDYVNISISDEKLTFTYDNKKSPFLNFKPTIVLIDDFYSFKNNAITEILTDLSDNSMVYQKNYTYTYDNDDYAISKTHGTETITYEYYE